VAAAAFAPAADRLEAEGERFRTAFAGATASATERAGARHHDLVLGGRVARLTFAGGALEPAVLPAFGHLARVAGAPDVRFVLWDSASTGVVPPPLPDDLGAIGLLGEVERLSGGPVRATLHYRSGGLTLWDADARTATTWFPSSDAVPWWERVGPLRAAMSHALAGPRRQLVHAGAVGTARGGALIGGPSGAGKSTTCVTCLERGLRFAGDDQILLDITGPRPVAHSLHRTAKLERDALGRLPSVADALWPEVTPAEGKAMLLLDGVRAERVTPALGLTHAVVPRVVDAERTELRPLPRPVALRALAPSSIFTVPRDRGAQLATLAAALRTLTCAELRLGRDGRAAEVLAEALG
jgi:hypothetical protein